MDEIEKRKQDFIKKLKEKQNYIVYTILGLIVAFGCYIRTRNISLLKDSTTGKFIPLALDPFVFLRYAKYILDHGSLMVNDTMRYFPLGLNVSKEATMVSYVSVYLYKILHFFNSNITIEYAHDLYPVIFFAIGLIFFFLLVRKLFDYRIALLSCAILTIVPGYLYRTLFGFADKEALGMALMFAIFYFFLLTISENNLKKSILFSIISGFLIGLMNTSWGGVTSVYLIIGGFIFVSAFFERITKKNFLVIGVFIFSLILFSYLITNRFTMGSFFTSLTSGIIVVGYLILISNYLLFTKNIFRIKDKLKFLPKSVISLIFIFIFGSLSYFLIFGVDSFKNKIILEIYDKLFKPFGTTRWILTVAESHQPYITDWVGQMGWFVLLFALLGSILLFYNLIKDLNESKGLTIIYSIFIFSFIFSRYSPNSQLNGSTLLSLFLYIGSLAIFSMVIFSFYINTYFKDKIKFNKIKEIIKINRNYIFVFSWFFFMSLAARGALRLIFVFLPVAAILFGYFVVKIFDYLKKYDKYKLLGQVILIGIIIIFIFLPLTESTLYQAEHTGPSYNEQWQVAMNWVKENTPKNSVFAHWWDYGYWVQTGGERTTITDGGNFIYAWNYFMGRHVLTAHSEDEALEFLKSHDANYLLMISDDIGKYSAYSSIGADENYDRYSWISTFTLDQNNMKETRNQTVLPFVGGTLLDHDFVYNDVLFPGQQAGIAGFLVPIKISNTTVELSQPTAVLVYNNQQYQIPVECVYYAGNLHKFPQKGLDGCLRIIPVYNENQMNAFGALLYLSPEVSKTLFAKLYLFNEQSDNFKLVYDDSNNMPLALYNGVGLIGPLKIWQVNYPDYIQKNDTYIGLELPDPKVMEV